MTDNTTDTERAGLPDDVAEQNAIRAVVAFHEICDALNIPRMEQEPCADRALAEIAMLTSALHAGVDMADVLEYAEAALADIGDGEGG